MKNLATSLLAVTSVFLFALWIEMLIAERVVQIPVHTESMWHCDGWSGVMYPNEKSMRKAIK